MNTACFASTERCASLVKPKKQIYETLGLAWIPPELRENCGEVEAALEGRLPTLMRSTDIRGDLHIHTTETDGRATLEEMAEAARGMGYEYIAITDHSKALAMANGLDEERVVAFAKRVREMDQAAMGIRVFSGLECDIRRDGSMDIEEDALAELDFVIGSVHSYMNLEAAEMTDRLLRALESPSLRALGHGTGRVLLHREPFPFDFDAVVTAAVARRVAGNQRQPRAAGSGWSACACCQSSGSEVRHQYRRPSSEAPPQHALWRDDGPAGMAGSGRRDEYSSAGRICRGNQKDMKLISSKEKLRTPIFRVTQDHAVDPDGFEIRRAIVQHDGSAVMLAADDRKRVLLVRQYRFACTPVHVGIAGGAARSRRDSLLKAAKRELQEETGYRAKKWKKLVSFYPKPRDFWPSA